MYQNISGSESSIRSYDFFTNGISGDLESWLPVDPITRSRQSFDFNPDKFKRNISEHDNIDDQFAEMEQIIVDAVEESLEIDDFVDFCASNPFQCHPDASCKNGDTSVECTCNANFEGNGFECEPINPCKSESCDAEKEDCLKTGPSSFSCECKSGYQKSGSICQGKRF